MLSKRVQSFPLRLCSSVREQAVRLAMADGISLNHFISLAVAEKISRMEHDTWMRSQPHPQHAGRQPTNRQPY